jgi:hypothetical protein
MSWKPYAHLKADEKAICERWLKAASLQGKMEYDVHLDTPTLNAPAWWTKKDLTNWNAVTAKRIDLVVHASDAIWVMEITPKVSKAAVGGCMFYKGLYEKQFHPSLPVKIGIICEMDDPSYHWILKNNKIRLWVV